MVGTFDPPHLGHEATAKAALVQGNLDVVVLIPNDLTPHKPFRTQTPLRLQMLDAAFQHDSKISYPESLDYGFPIIRGVMGFIHKNLNPAKIVGIIGSDVASSTLKTYFLNSFGIDEWMILTRENESLDDIPKMIQASPAQSFVGPAGFSSTQIRDYLHGHPEFYESEDYPWMEALPLHSGTAALIRKTGIYHPCSWRKLSLIFELIDGSSRQLLRELSPF